MTCRELPELRVTPDRYMTVRYAGASGDFNPIHSTRTSPSRRDCQAGSCTGCGPWRRSLGRRPRPAAVLESLKRLSVQFRGVGLPEHEIVVSGEVTRVEDGRAVVATVAEQDGNRIVRNAEAEIELGDGRP